MSAQSDLLGERIARQCLVGPPGPSVVEAVRVTTAIQAQDTPASRLGVRVRAPGCTDRQVTRAIEQDRSIVRTWLMRGTIHLVATADVRWLVRLIGPAVQRKARTRWHQLGLTDDVLAASLSALPEILAAGPLDRHEIRTALGERGVTLDSPDQQVHTHVIIHACTMGMVCRGPDRGRASTFVLTDDWLGDAPAGPDGDDALAELARRYFTAYSPATSADFTTWSGLPSGRAVELIRDELSAADVDGQPGFRLGHVEPARGVRLLPPFDNYVLGYRDRAAIVAPPDQPAVYQGGMIRAVVTVDGAVTGTWRLDRAAGHVTVSAFRSVGRAVRSGIRAEVEDIGRFLDRPLTLGYET